jgi:hypothetical protein
VCAATELRTPEQLGQRIAQGAGCQLPCLGLLQCNHPCPLSCHPFDHDKVSRATKSLLYATKSFHRDAASFLSLCQPLSASHAHR